MSYRLDNKLLPVRVPNQATDCSYLKEDFATWRAVALAKDNAHVHAEDENRFGCDCFQRLCGPGVCDLANDAHPRS